MAEIDAVWLTRVLRASGALDDQASVASAQATRIGEGVGFLGQLASIALTYDGATPDVPASVVAKLPAEHGMARQMAAAFGLYRCEVNFYRHVAGTMSVRTPRCYFADVNEDGTEALLLLEDLTTSGTLGDQVAGCTAAEAGMAIDRLAALHARWWGDADVERMQWLPAGLDLARNGLTNMYPNTWRPSLERVGHMLTEEQRAVVPTLNQRVLDALAEFDEVGSTFTHGDYRLDNVFFGRGACGYDVAVIDWQLANRGIGTYDMAYFVATNVETDVRRASQMELLRAYHDRLLEGGVRDYDWDRCVDDYRRSMVALLALEMMTIANIETSNERGLRLFEMIVRRVSDAVTDLDALTMLE
ncbi:MAG TPA: phosphotransferase [Dehalococcoidia bacterium]